MNLEELKNKIFNIKSESDFKDLSLSIFAFQYDNNVVYREWSDLLKRNKTNVKNIEDIPFLPISFFKTHKVVSFKEDAIHFFKSSGTTSENSSKHFIIDFNIYERSFIDSFNHFFGNFEDYCFIALLPNYLDQGNSSLIYMMDYFIKHSNHKESCFFNNNLEGVISTLKHCEENNIKTILFGVTYALLDLIEIEKLSLKNTIVFETGGMKGRRQEMIKSDLHKLLWEGLGVKSIASEYGVCELFSQTYSKKKGIFNCPNHMKVLIRDTYDSLSLIGYNKTGGINIIDLANLYTCSFIATEDLGRKYDNESFEILGRIDNSAIRGCNLMYDFR